MMEEEDDYHYGIPSSASSEGGSTDELDMVETPEVLPGSPRPREKRDRLWKQPSSGLKQSTVLQTKQRAIYTAGRPPWYNTQGQLVEPFVIGLCGGSASGKTTLAEKIIEELNVPWVTLLSMDSFYKVLDQEEHELAHNNKYNFDHPDAFDFNLLIETVRKLKEGKRVDVPIYNFVTHSREKRMVRIYPGAIKVSFIVLPGQTTECICLKIVTVREKCFIVPTDVVRVSITSPRRWCEQKTMYGANVIIAEGILLFSNPDLLKLLDMKVFIDTDSDIRLARRLKRDISERGRELRGVLKQYETFVKPAFDYYIAPTVVHADLIVPRACEFPCEWWDGCSECAPHMFEWLCVVEGGHNLIAVNLIVQHVHTQLQLRGLKLRSQLAQQGHIDQPYPNSLHILPPTSQVTGLHTLIRNRTTPRDEFIFYSKRLMRLLLEHVLTLLSFQDVEVETFQGIPYHGKQILTKKICGVSILRAGETMEQALCDVLKDVRLGKILIQTNPETDEAELYYLRLPKDIKEYTVIVMDATVATGAAAMMAIRILLDHDVPEENITLCSLLMADAGVHTIAYAFPRVNIVTTHVDHEMNDKFHIIPGIGNFGDRYFGTEDTIL
ncbi:UCKL1 [Cordylochernes scorpioides]|uniref:uridine/cytidine kinase n=1 Tax=Cordylochernes scorpioides TaxID=51811 RepID=A0ABY6K4V5_9ARAC|nr:UCKL1 [Cordylochernes scorpioides]